MPSIEEFALCLPQCPADEGLTVVDRLRAATPNDRTCSAGVAQWDGAETIDRLFGRADQALYAAKASGRDRTVLSDLNSGPERPSISVVA